MVLSNLAHDLLEVHARQPKQLFYAVEVLGSMFRDSDLQQLDEAYRELETNKFMEYANFVVSYFGSPKRLYRITQEGSRAAAGQHAA